MIARRRIRFVNLLYLHVCRLRELGEETDPRVRAFFSKFGWSLWKAPSDIDLWGKDLED